MLSRVTCISYCSLSLPLTRTHTHTLSQLSSQSISLSISHSFNQLVGQLPTTAIAAAVAVNDVNFAANSNNSISKRAGKGAGGGKGGGEGKNCLLSKQLLRDLTAVAAAAAAAGQLHVAAAMLLLLQLLSLPTLLVWPVAIVTQQRTTAIDNIATAISCCSDRERQRSV